MTVDTVVVGGGPAGAVTAIELARAGRAVAIVERTAASPVGPPRVGEHLAPELRAALVRLRLWDAVVAAAPVAAAAMRSAFGGPDVIDRAHVLAPWGPSWHVDRAALDAALRASAIEHGVTVVTARARTVGGRPGAWRLATSAGVLAAEVLVDATGRAAWLARRLGARVERLDRLIAAVAWSRAPIEPWGLVESTPDGWWFSGPAGDGAAVAMFATDHDLWRERGWDAALAAAPHTRARLAGHALTRPRVVDAASQVVVRTPDTAPGWLPVGDAARAPDPLSGGGVLDAVRSAVAVAHRVAGGAAPPPPGADYLAARAATYALETRWPDAPFWSRRRGREDLAPQLRRPPRRR